MRIVDLLHEQGIDLNFNPKNKAEAIDMLIDLMDKTGNLNDKQGYKEAILAREDLSTTGIGDGIAIPHGKTKAVKNANFVIENIEYTYYEKIIENRAYKRYWFEVKKNN